MNSQLLPRYAQWREQYNAHRYAEHLNQADLNRRIRDIVMNMLHLTTEAQIDLGPITVEGAIWIEKWTHMLQEMRLRYGPYPAGFTRDIFHSEPFPNLASELAKKAAARIASLGLTHREVLVKYGKAQHMRHLYDAGLLRIQPADFFSQVEQNVALKDDELNRIVSLQLSRREIVKVVKNPDAVPENIPPLCQVTIKSPSNYWLYCLSRSVEARLFIDFNADSCVIIRKPKQFAILLDQATHDLGGAMHHGSVSYMDPLLPELNTYLVPFMKHFRFAYQDEYRFFWLPRLGAPKLTQLNIEIGSLGDIADLILL
jgi:hypothetical protein